MIIRLIRHAESDQQAGKVNSTVVGDCNVALSRPAGVEQAIALGARLGTKVFSESLIYSSPYLRCKQSSYFAMKGAGCLDLAGKVLEDPRLREMCFGYNKNQEAVDREKELRKIHGWFYYRLDGGDSPADVYDRICTFLESMKRQAKRKNVNSILIFTHGITMRSFVMRFMHLTVEDYIRMDNNNNCDIITITKHQNLENPQFTRGKWGCEGIVFRKDEQ